MRKTIIFFIAGMLFYQCTNSDKTVKKVEDTSKAQKNTINIDSSQFIITQLKSDADNIILLNEILKDTKYQLPYTHNYFYTIEGDRDISNNISIIEKASIVNQNKKANETFRFKNGDIKYYDTLNKKMQSSAFIQTDEESYNKEVIRISRPYQLNEKEVIIFFFETLLYYRDNQPGPVVGGSWAIRFIKENNKWIQKAYYPGFDLS